jgi:hypothetical protein
MRPHSTEVKVQVGGAGSPWCQKDLSFRSQNKVVTNCHKLFATLSLSIYNIYILSFGKKVGELL